MEDIRPDLSENVRKRCLETFEVHPLLVKKTIEDEWIFSEEQIEIVLLAQYITKLGQDELAQFVSKMRLTPGLLQDLVAMLIDLFADDAFDKVLGKISGLILAMTKLPSKLVSGIMPENGRYLAAFLALMTIGRYFPQGSLKYDRAEALISLCGGRTIKALNFSDTISSFEFKNMTFEACVFLQTTWDNCIFDRSVKYDRCRFIGGSITHRSQGFALVVFEDCIFDQEATLWVDSIRLKEGSKRYSAEELRADIGCIIEKFSGKGGYGFKTVEETNLLRGRISASRFKLEIIDHLRTNIMEPHHISGTSEKGYHIRQDAQEAIRFYLSNNVFIGPLRKAYGELRIKLGISE